MIPFNRNSAIVQKFATGGPIPVGPDPDVDERLIIPENYKTPTLLEPDPMFVQNKGATDEWMTYDDQGLTQWEMWQMAENGETSQEFADWIKSSILPMPEITQGMSKQEIQDHLDNYMVSIQQKHDSYKRGRTDRYGRPMSEHRKALGLEPEHQFELPVAEASSTRVNMNPYIIE